MPNFASSSKTCSQCGAPVPVAAPEGLCPRCVAALNLGADTAFTEGADSPMPSPTPKELAPHFPQLEIIECLGRGGMGVVYKARQTSLGRLIALKLLAPERVGDATFAERFAQEAKALATLNHPNIVTIHDFGQAGGYFYLLMEFVDGVNLRQAMKVGRFTPEQALTIVPPVCEALQYAHEHGIVHRDIKPENLLMDKEGRLKIADFGVAKILHADDPNISVAESQPVGTPQYMAPEQKDHRRTDHRADIYSLGVVLYELLTGELPAGKLQPPSRKVEIDVRLDEIVLRALEKTPELRFATAADFRTQVELLTSAPTRPARANESRPIKAGFGLPNTAKRRRIADLVVGGVSAAAGLLLMWLYSIQANGPGGPPMTPVPIRILLIVACGYLAFFTIRAVWRAVHRPVENHEEAMRPAAPESATTSSPAAIALGIALLVLAIAVPTAGMVIHNREMQINFAERQKPLALLHRESMEVNRRIGDANANAGRAASRAGNGALPDDVRARAREEQQLHEREAKRAQEEAANVNARLAAAMSVTGDAKPWRAMLILLSALPFTFGGLVVLERSGISKKALKIAGLVVCGVVAFILLFAVA